MTSVHYKDFEITADPLLDIEILGQEWRALETQSAGHSFFLSWHWIGAWLYCLPRNIAPLVLRVKLEGQLAGLAILCKGMTPVLRIFRQSQLSLNTAGDGELDSITLEYNGFLSISGMEEGIAQAALKWLLQGYRPNQVLRLDGIDPKLAILATQAIQTRNREVFLERFLPAPFVDLEDIRNSGKDYLEHLSRNSRQALKRSLRYYEKSGPVRYHIAATLSEAIKMLDELRRAHQATWRGRGKPGAFSRPFFNLFHQKLIASAFGDGNIEMASVSSGGEPIGYLYNFIWKEITYAYQSGFNYTDDKIARPGYVAHYLAVNESLTRGRKIYDFMAGGGQHKTSLSTGKRDLVWIQLRRKTLLVRLDTTLRKILSAMQYGVS